MISFSKFKLLEENLVPEHGTQYGSNEGAVHVNTTTGEKFYVKYPKSEEQAHVEAATSDIYNALGIKTLNPKVKDVNGRSAVVTKWKSDIDSLTSPEDYHRMMSNPERAKELALMHHASIMTGNRDVIGLDYTNVMKNFKTGELYSVDQGGSMHFRAQGGNKPFEADISDVESFQNPRYSSGQVFSRLPKEVLKDTSKDLNKLTDVHIDMIMKKHGLEKYANVIKNRRDMLIKHFA
jgi:hypothetical protein